MKAGIFYETGKIGVEELEKPIAGKHRYGAGCGAAYGIGRGFETGVVGLLCSK